jgi:hypothetical protein
MVDKSFKQLLSELNEFDERERAMARADYAEAVKSAGKPSPALVKSMRVLDETATKIRRQAKAREEAQAAARPVLGLMLKAAINNAVLAGRLSGTSAVAGLRALGLED